MGVKLKAILRPNNSLEQTWDERRFGCVAVIRAGRKGSGVEAPGCSAQVRWAAARSPKKRGKASRTNGGPNSEVRRQGTVYADYNYVGSYPLETDTRIVSRISRLHKNTRYFKN